MELTSKPHHELQPRSCGPADGAAAAVGCGAGRLMTSDAHQCGKPWDAQGDELKSPAEGGREFHTNKDSSSAQMSI